MVVITVSHIGLGAFKIFLEKAVPVFTVQIVIVVLTINVMVTCPHRHCH